MQLLPRLIDHIHLLGYEIRGGDLFRDPRVHGLTGEDKGYGHKNSCHKLKLAIDLYLTRDGVYLKGEHANQAHSEIHDWWDDHGGARRISGDLNHYSLEHNGFR